MRSEIPTTYPATLFDRSWPGVPNPMAVHAVLSPAGRLDDERLARAVRLSLDAEPILGCAFVERWFRPYWRRRSDLDETSCLEVRASGDSPAEEDEFFRAPPGPPLRVLVLRGERDRLCIKLDHHLGDGGAVKEYAYLLAEIYGRLESEPDYRPEVRLGDRSLRPIASRFDAAQKWRLLRQAIGVHRGLKRLQPWRYPVPASGRAEFDYVSWRLEPDRVSALFEYGYRLRATLSQVLLGAFFLAAAEEMPPGDERPLPAGMAIDLRRFFPAGTTPAMSNLVGVSVVGLGPETRGSLSAAVEEIRRQMDVQRRHLGLAVSFFPLEALPGIRHLVALRPYGRPKLGVEKPPASAASAPPPASPLPPPDTVDGWMILTHVGALDPSRLVFDGAEVVDAFVTGGVFRWPGLLGLGVSSFRGALTLYVGCGPTRLVTRLRERMDDLLPSPAAAAE